MRDLSNIWRGIRIWPPEERLALASRILQSLQQEQSVPVSKERKEALRELIGFWKMEHPPGDDEVQRIIQEDRMKKYG